MRNLAVFLALAFIFYLIGYVIVRGYQSLSQYNVLKISYVVGFLLLFLILVASFIFVDNLPIKVSSPLSFISYTFLLVFIYLGILFFIVDFFRIINFFFFHFSPSIIQSFRLWSMIAGIFIIAIALVIGNYNFNRPKLTTINVESNKPLKNKEIKIVAASDIHLGSYINSQKLKKYVSLINAQHPDIVLFVGDIADRNITSLIKQKMNKELLKINAPMGVFGVSGNHEYYAHDRYENYKYYEKCGIQMLIDKSVMIDSSFYIVGRDDQMNRERMELADMMRNFNKNLPVILLDHQPFHLSDAENNNVDLQLSGHTHNGQFFPGNLFVKNMYKLGYGYMKEGNTSYYVSSGLGIWGPEYRIGTKSEIVVINFKY